MRFIRFWNKLSDYILDFLRVVSVLLILFSLIMIIINLIIRNNEEVYMYSVIVAVSCYLNNKLNGG